MVVSRFILPVLTAMLMATSAPAQSVDEITVARFAQEGLSEWKVKKFEGETNYQLVEMDGRTVLQAQAQAQGTASGLIREMAFDPKKYRYLNWSWKIRHTVAGGDARSKKGDDYAARIYVVFPEFFFWQTRALNYTGPTACLRGSSFPTRLLPTPACWRYAPAMNRLANGSVNSAISLQTFGASSAKIRHRPVPSPS